MVLDNFYAFRPLSTSLKCSNRHNKNTHTQQNPTFQNLKDPNPIYAMNSNINTLKASNKGITIQKTLKQVFKHVQQSTNLFKS